MLADERLKQRISPEKAHEILGMSLSDIPLWCRGHSAEQVTAVIDWLKGKSEQNWGANIPKALEYADTIISIGKTLEDVATVALGTMARGDALKIPGDRNEDAWATLDEAGELFKEAGQRVGWARTRIGKLFISLDLKRQDIALEDAQAAEQILREENQAIFLIRLKIAVGQLYSFQGQNPQAKDQYEEALAIAQGLGEAGEGELSNIYNNLGMAYQQLGNLEAAYSAFKIAKQRFEQEGKRGYAAVAQWNIGGTDLVRGFYRQGIQLIQEAQKQLQDGYLYHAMLAQRDLARAYLDLNHDQEARQTLEQALEWFKNNQSHYHLASILMNLAIIETRDGNLEAAYTALDDAEALLLQTDSEKLIAVVNLQRAQIAFSQENLDKTYSAATAAASVFEETQQWWYFSHALLLIAKVKIAQGSFTQALCLAHQALVIARQRHIRHIRHDAYVVIGQAHEQAGKLSAALCAYRAASALLEKMHRDLTITLRSSHLENKMSATHGLIRIYLQQDQPELAFMTLERLKALSWLDYLNGRGQLRWVVNEKTEPLIRELEWLRARHRWLEEQTNHRELRACEREIQRVLENLYLHSHRPDAELDMPGIGVLKTALKTDVLIEYYSDGQTWWAFVLDDGEMYVYKLPISPVELDKLINSLRRNITDTINELKFVDDPYEQTGGLTHFAQKNGAKLFQALLKPLRDHLQPDRRLVIVPYGMLHYLPFNILYDGHEYLIQQHEIVILPSATLITRPAVRRTQGALALAHQWSGKRVLKFAAQEARSIYERFGGNLFTDEAMQIAALDTPACQILHIASHGAFRIDQPDFSHIKFADGELHADDLFQRDLSYELVTLSACETLRAKAASGDDLIGLARGFLYAGAGALVASLWEVHDRTTFDLMDQFYAALCNGDSKAAALGNAQRQMLAQHPKLHPALWGAFQLMGNPAALNF